MQIIDNINKTVKDDLQVGIHKGSKMSVAAACFSIYAYQELKKQLEGIDELRFIFTSPTFVTEKTSKAQREFYIPRISRESSLYGTEFEVKLRNELTQKAIAKECADWIRRKAVFKSNVTQEQMMGFMTVDESTYMPINGFTTVDLGCERGNNAYYPVQKTESFENANYFLGLFEQLWNDKKKLQEVTDIVIENISAAYRENAPEYIYFVALYNIFKEFLDDVSEDELPNEATGFKKIIIFTAFSDTADYLYENVSKFAKENYGLETAEITGTVDGKTTIPKLRADLNTVLTCFSPVSKGKSVLLPGSKDELDILIATDCISEGQNLQDCDYLINYDIHWNPVRIIQRFGRIDRIGSKNDHIQLVNFWPDMDLDEYINLKSRVETRMKISVMTSTGDDDLINAEEKGDLEYRRAQLKRLQEEVVDIEDMTSGISIMDLGLNEFRLDLLEYMKQHEDIETAPKGLHTVVGQTVDSPAGVIFVLRNINDSVNIDNRNRIHPFYMVYISEEGEIVCDYLNPKKLLDTMRLLCRGKSEPCMELCKRFNDETDDGRKMGEISELLSEAINSIIDVKEENDIDSLFMSGGTTALLSAVSGLDDFELICFVIVK